MKKRALPGAVSTTSLVGGCKPIRRTIWGPTAGRSRYHYARLGQQIQLIAITKQSTLGVVIKA